MSPLVVFRFTKVSVSMGVGVCGAWRLFHNVEIVLLCGLFTATGYFLPKLGREGRLSSLLALLAEALLTLICAVPIGIDFKGALLLNLHLDVRLRVAVSISFGVLLLFERALVAFLNDHRLDF